ncbi:MAG: hypothetical protein JW934_16445 [Anaerolineae bacterium]|nr:hypothetical protein [Anaerolineae bacterium]
MIKSRLAPTKNKRHVVPHICLTCKHRQTDGPNHWFCEREVSYGLPDIIYNDTDHQLVCGLAKSVRQTCDRWAEYE